MSTDAQTEPGPPGSDGPKRQASGGARQRAAGKVHVNLGLDPEIGEILRDAARSEYMPLTQFVIKHAVVAAKKILAKGG